MSHGSAVEDCCRIRHETAQRLEQAEIDLANLSEAYEGVKRHRDRLQVVNNDYLDRARIAEEELKRLRLFRFDDIARAVERAEAHVPFVDLNHAYGVLAEEMSEFLDEVRRNHGARARLELLDIIGPAIKAVKAIERKEIG